MKMLPRNRDADIPMYWYAKYEDGAERIGC